MDTWIHSDVFKDTFIRLDSFMCLHFVLMLICNWAIWRFQHGLPSSCHKPQISCRVIFSHQQTNKKQEASFPPLPTKSLHRLLCLHKSSDSKEKYKNKLNVQNHKQVAFIYNLMELLLLKWRNCLLNYWGVDWNGKNMSTISTRNGYFRQKPILNLSVISSLIQSPPVPPPPTNHWHEHETNLQRILLLTQRTCLSFSSYMTNGTSTSTSTKYL